ncbi:hypothetical protein IW262DRAFT_1467620 [Armillaria fumosa]|nr:hypothetical protein IW262DRAFT_1467620 [Armillaria fumosa]
MQEYTTVRALVRERLTMGFDLDEEDIADASTVAESSRCALVEVLGIEKRDRLLTVLYLVQQDGVAVVHQSSIQIWKALVNNTPRTAVCSPRKFPELINQIIVLISSDEFEQQETSGHRIAELCHNFGEKTVSEILAVLKGKVTSTDSRTKKGVCLVLSEIMENSTDSMKTTSYPWFACLWSMTRPMSALQQQKHLMCCKSPKAIDEIIPTLLKALRQPGESSGTARAQGVTVQCIPSPPTLTAAPMSMFNAHAVASLVTIAGSALSMQLMTITSTFAKVIEDETDEELISAMDESKHDTLKQQKSAYEVFSIFCEEIDLDTSLYHVDWIKKLISAMEDHYDDIYSSAVQTIDVFLMSIPKDVLV